MPLILGTNSIKDTGYDVANSLRFNIGSTDYLNRTSGTSSNTNVWSLSMWIKRSDVSSSGSQKVFSAGSGSTDRTEIYFGTDDKLNIFRNISGSEINIATSMVFRDPSSWYHTLWVWNGTAITLYVNGASVTLSATNLGTNKINGSSTVHRIGIQHDNSSQNFGGYLAEVTFLDATAVSDATSFGEFDSDSGIWKPINVSGLTFGNNGFYLDFEDSSALGNDAAGSNNFTVNNLTATDQSTDTCTNNFAIGNPLLNYNPVLSEGNLVLTSSGTAWKNSMSTIGVSSGIWYHEVKITAESGVPYQLIGVTDSYHPNSWGASPPNYLGVGALQIGYYNDNGSYYKGDSQTSYGASFGVNDIIGVLLDLDAGTPTIKFYKNDADQGSINLPTSSNSTGLWFFMQSMYISTCSVNYGSPAHAISSGNTDGNGWGNFEFATKGGYTLNTKNLAEHG